MNESEETILLSPSSPDRFWFGNLEFNLNNDFVLAASAMPEMEEEGQVIIPDKPMPYLWRAWVVAIGPGIHLPKAIFTFNPGIQNRDYIHFLPENGKFFYFDKISFVFVKMQDIDIVARP